MSGAAASGSRAQRELDKLRDEFRRRLSTRFQEQMRDMRREAEQIDERQQGLAERLAELETAERPSRSLRAQDDQQELVDEFQDQEERVDDLLQEIEGVVKEAEASEPLLAQELYDTYRRTKQRNVSESLRSTQESLDRGMTGDAQAQRLAREGIEQLRAGIDRAAESVLGDETAALRRAREELDRLTQQLDQEITRNAS